MVVVSYSGKEINAKLVYYGAGLSGKTTNLESIYEAVPDSSRGKMVSMKTQSDRTLFFDLLPLDLGEIMGFKTRFLLYTVPGQVFYNATRKLVLKGADAIVFVADSEVGKMEENRESIANLRANLTEYGLNLDEIPWVIQYNKRDLPNLYTLEELNAELNPGGRVPFFEAVATQGKGVFETFRGISHLLMEKVTRDLRRTPATSHRAEGESVMMQSPVRPDPARSDPQRFSAAPLPTPPARAIAREAKEASVAEPMAPVGGLDYGREIQLPVSFPPMATAPDLASEPMAIALAPRGNASKASSGTAESAAQAPAAPAPSATRPAATAPAVSPLATEWRSAPASPPAAAPNLTSVAQAPKPARVADPTPAPEATNGGAGMGQSAPETISVPIRMPRGGTREIVLRIVLTTED